jgi:hypothetical protein
MRSIRLLSLINVDQSPRFPAPRGSNRALFAISSSSTNHVDVTNKGVSVDGLVSAKEADYGCVFLFFPFQS